MEPKTICHECGTEMVRDTRPHEVKYKQRSEAIQLTGWFCDKCGEILMTQEDGEAYLNLGLAMKAEVDGLMLADEITRIRRKLGLSQRRAGAILGGGARSFQKYESGCGWISRPMANLLRLLDNDPERLKELIQAKK